MENAYQHLGLSKEELFSMVDHNDLETEKITAPRYSYWSSVFRVFFRKKINIVMFDAEHERIKEILEKNASTRDYKIIPVNEDSLTHVFRITEALDRREYVCFQGDRYLNKEKLLTTSFMGKEAKFPMGPFLLASKLKVPVVFYFAMREAQRTYRFHFFIAETVVRTKEKRAEQALLEQYTQTLEKIVRQYPEQWFNYYPFWT